MRTGAKGRLSRFVLLLGCASIAIPSLSSCWLKEFLIPGGETVHGEWQIGYGHLFLYHTELSIGLHSETREISVEDGFSLHMNVGRYSDTLGPRCEAEPDAMDDRVWVAARMPDWLRGRPEFIPDGYRILPRDYLGLWSVRQDVFECEYLLTNDWDNGRVYAKETILSFPQVFCRDPETDLLFGGGEGLYVSISMFQEKRAVDYRGDEIMEILPMSVEFTTFHLRATSTSWVCEIT